MKNEVEQKMTLHAHIKDAVAVTKIYVLAEKLILGKQKLVK